MPTPSPPDEQRCRATTKGEKVRGEYWAPPRRCGHWVRADGYCWQHRPSARPVQDAPPEERA